MTLRRKLLLFVALPIFVLLALAIVLPIIYKDKIIDRARIEINKQLNANVKFSELDLTFLSTFPRFSVQVNDLDIVGKYEFDSTHLIKAKSINATLDFWSVWGGGPYKITGLTLDNPKINVVVLKNGKANYDITKPSTSTSKSSGDGFVMNLERYELNNADIHYTDFGSDLIMQLNGTNHSGTGDLSASHFLMKTQTKADELNFSYGGVPYLSKIKLKADIEVEGDMPTSKYTLRNNEVFLNELQLKPEGFVQLVGEIIRMDFKVKAPSADFRQLLSVLPGMYSDQVAGLDAKGNFSLAAFMKGDINDKTGAFPAFGGDLKVNNASFKYASLPLGVSGIAADMSLKSPSMDMDKMVLDMRQLKFLLGSNPFDVKFLLKTPISDPDVDGSAKGTINLADIQKAIPAPDMQAMSGIIKADVVAKARMSDIDQKKYDQVQMKGDLQVQNMNVQAKGQPATQISDARMTFTPNNVQLANLQAKIGKSDIQANGVIDNLLALLGGTNTMTGKMTMRSNYLDANEFLSTPTENENAGLSQVGEEAVVKPFDRFHIDLDAAVKQLKYDKHDVRNLTMAGQFAPNRIDIRQFSGMLGTSDIAASGTINNVFGYLYDGDVLGGDINLKSNFLDLNSFMTDAPTTTTTTTTAAPADVLLVPSLIKMLVSTDLKKVNYTNVVLENVRSVIAVENREAKIVNGTANTLGGQVGLAGGYDTRDAAHPKFDLKYDLRNFDFQKTFQTFVTVQKLAPLVKFMSGKFNTTMALSGELGKDMTPNLETLNLAGMIHTLQAALAGLKPMQEISRLLNVSYLQTLDVKDTRNWIEVKNGKVHLVDGDYQMKDVMMRIGGDHGIIGQDMKYNLLAKVPRKILEQNAVGAAASVGMTALNAQASKYGINIKQGDFVNVLFTITGSMLKPDVAMKLLGSDGQTTIQEAVQQQVDAVVDKAKDSVKTRANEELDKAKDKAKAEADKVVDAATARAEAEAEKLKQQAIEAAKKKAGEVVGQQVGDQIQDQLDKTKAGERAKAEAEKLKEKLDGWDPFGGGKKKKGQ
jgi:AsmA-like C-terminal region